MAKPDNQLVHLLPRKDRSTLMALWEKVPLALSEVVGLPGETTRNVYFPIDGFISLVTSVDDSATIEVGMVGREGMLGAQVVLGVATSPLRAVVQGGGTAWRVPVKVFSAQLAASPVFKRILDRYVHVLMMQLATSAICLRHHQIGPRLARWLLMSQDRAMLDTFRMTHEFLGYMLGVRRVGITSAASALQQGGLIDYSRGRLTVVDRAGLEDAACACYSHDRKDYADVLG